MRPLRDRVGSSVVMMVRDDNDAKDGTEWFNQSYGNEERIQRRKTWKNEQQHRVLYVHRQRRESIGGIFKEERE